MSADESLIFVDGENLVPKEECRAVMFLGNDRDVALADDKYRLALGDLG